MNVIELKILTSHFDPALKIALDQDPIVPITRITLDHDGFQFISQAGHEPLDLATLKHQTRELKGQPTLFYQGQRLFGFRHSQKWLLFK
ncbi:hypothetical protein [Secundilactobacillus paracollinoides]|uniref:hypothetical protein n=1 Tax=Secundilactobacillus paracollinoides TaxID=240427 RepID=UPI0006F1A6D1|nr:hypothetical protein [Secundilactobacillus paracollinoides]KRL75768.1 hypothetical protein FC17_GL002499 [Secundilactobacillus paracollinoides DSM 15502 = JCM 11969]